ncbi:hypothetical protein H5410_056929 [Solanum commersonii]|uniref:Uncharacterized protein n=1 Tax=Solanum commersonii TaxID=4109 RepID=A0A9J5WLK7_SOLCO|nr:hypothetical protein H5410_056929 [Solanum commersonii]
MIDFGQYYEFRALLLAIFDSVPPSSVRTGTSLSSITIGATPPFLGPRVGFQTPGLASVPSLGPPIVGASLIFASATMSVAKKKSFDRFVRLAPPRFGDTSRDKTYEVPWSGLHFLLVFRIGQGVVEISSFL